jgi:hypothetical protein
VKLKRKPLKKQRSLSVSKFGPVQSLPRRALQTPEMDVAQRAPRRGYD